ncbi:hypothetical protein FANTH_7778 [Fusarium anthophilum]|uniref:Uncharacterized protein n=1 Tax=Fusarium anthophilum TaxID=48485 RepID=A0A8H4ZDA9_9HYPO|nr:hypothetical protein FANTH_7778 [Fusarium anthophilum]
MMDFRLDDDISRSEEQLPSLTTESPFATLFDLATLIYAESRFQIRHCRVDARQQQGQGNGLASHLSSLLLAFSLLSQPRQATEDNRRYLHIPIPTESTSTISCVLRTVTLPRSIYHPPSTSFHQSDFPPAPRNHSPIVMIGNSKHREA